MRWCGLCQTDDTDEPLQKIYEAVPELLLKLLRRKSTPKELVEKACAAFRIPEGGI